VHRGENAGSSIAGVLSIHPNSHVTSIKADPWPQVLALMGKEGERAMIDLLLDCGIYLAVGSGHGTYHQLSGTFDPLKVLDSLMKEAIHWVIFNQWHPNHYSIRKSGLSRKKIEVHRTSPLSEIE
jgi:hypothetical protein